MNALLLLATTLQLEAGCQSYMGKFAVAQVIMERVADSRWPNTIEGVILQKKQFSCWNGKSKVEIWDICSAPNAIDKYNVGLAFACIDGIIRGNGYNHYYNPKLCRPKWADGVPEEDWIDIGDHRFIKL
jgi:N-acetylmuramoyl-L-alanine amidase